ncbi:MAG: DUF2617 family protein [Planctomycetes bacterium]|nr:DUF2617 family protein [Planctomycetota bacterium]
MTVGFVRPDVSELKLSILGRSVHPELLVVYERTSVVRDDFQLYLAICEAGHLLELRTPHQTLSEIVAPNGQSLPHRERFFDKKLRGSRDESLRLPGGVGYQVSFQVERLNPEVYLQLHEECSVDCRKATLGRMFDPPNRLAPAAVSYLQLDLFPRSLLVHAFHTFPENCAVVKTQTLIELPKAK